MKFTRIKSNFSQNRRIPRLGKIRLGLKVRKEKPGGQVVEYPKEVDYFVCPPEVEAVYGKQPKELDVIFPSDDEEMIFPQSLAWFGKSKGLKCKGDGEHAERLNEQTSQWEPMKCPCEHYKSDENPKGECTEQGILMMILPKVSVGGVYQLRTGSYHSVVDVNSGIDYVRNLVGRVAMVPLKLKRVPRTTHADGKPQTHYTLSLTMDATVEGINRLRDDTTRILTHKQVLIEGPVDENPALDPPDVTYRAGEVEIDDNDQVDAEDLADKDEEELAAIQQELQRRRAAKVAPPPSTPPAPNGGAGQIPKEDWKILLESWMEDPYLAKIINQWKEKPEIAVDNLYTLKAKGQQYLITYLKEEAKKIGVRVPL